ncbi:MAG: ribonuclease HII [Bdellovibrionota bacterium]
MIQKNNTFNRKTLKDLPAPFIGIDEVGRGCLAGPVCAGVVILNDKFPVKHFLDSKTLSEEKREALALEIRDNHHWALGWASVEEVDEINIRQATFVAMIRALRILETKLEGTINVKAGTLLIDGRDRLSDLKEYKQLPIIKGDQHMRCISAASIIAKVARDQLMAELAKDFPVYGFEKHKGYGTEVHRTAIENFKPTIHHRKTFGGVKEHL